jgi:hemerythrin-like domain-containing protein
MKRHSSFIPLSREHHEGLLLATRLQQGRNALLRLWSHDLNWQAEYIVKFFDDNLDTHFLIEETIVFPAARASNLNGGTIIQALLNEHAEMREMVEFFRHPSQKKLECTLTRFGEILENHIRCEERELFPLCEEAFSEEELENIGKNIRLAEKKAKE